MIENSQRLVKLCACIMSLTPCLAFAGNWGENWGTMVWGVPLVVPSTPKITNIDYGDEEIYLSVSVSNNGGSAISSYKATCTDGTNNYTGTSSTPSVTVSGVTNGVSYTCSATATNAAGTSASSASSSAVTPEPIATGLPIWLLYEAAK